MKALVKSFLLGSLVLGFSACSDVPAPYEINNGSVISGNTLPYSENSLSTFNSVTESGVAWSLGSTYAKATGYNSTDKTYTATKAWLVSPAINTTSESGKAYITFEYALRYGSTSKYSDYAQVLISTDFEGDVTTAHWTNLNYKPEQTASDWSFVDATPIILPDSLVNREKVNVAFVYTCGDAQSDVSTWEVKSFRMKAGEPTVEGGEDQPSTPGEAQALPYESANLNSDFNVQTLAGLAWSLGSSYAKASGYNSSDKSYSASTTYLVTPAINMAATEVLVKFDYALRYGTEANYKDYAKVMISSDYAGDVAKATWTDLNFDAKLSNASTWDLVASNEMAVPAAFLNKTCYIAFVYTCGATQNEVATWELKDLVVKAGKAAEGGNEGGGEVVVPEPTGDNLLADGGFETWADGKCPAWVSTTTAGNATVAQSTDAKEGTYAIEVKGTNASNKRIASKEMTLAAGSYTFSFWVKSAEAATCRPGYVPLKEDGTVGAYVYGDYSNGIGTEWQQVVYTFTLDAETKLNLVVMNSKTPGTAFIMDGAALYKNK